MGFNGSMELDYSLLHMGSELDKSEAIMQHAADLFKSFDTMADNHILVSSAAFHDVGAAAGMDTQENSRWACSIMRVFLSVPSIESQQGIRSVKVCSSDMKCMTTAGAGNASLASSIAPASVVSSVGGVLPNRPVDADDGIWGAAVGVSKFWNAVAVGALLIVCTDFGTCVGIANTYEGLRR